MAATYWVGQNGNIYYGGGDGQGVQNLGSATNGQYETRSDGLYDKFTDNGTPALIHPGTQISDPALSQNQNTGGGGGNSNAQANQQINTINSLLGTINSKRDAGISDLNSGAAEQQRLLDEQRTKAMTGYDTQNTQNQQDRERGYGQVDDFANTSANSLNRIFQGANAGNSSVARLLAPNLVGKAAGERRTGVTKPTNQRQAILKIISSMQI